MPFPSPGKFPDPRIEPRSPALQAGALPRFRDTREYLISKKGEAKSSHYGPGLLENIPRLLKDHQGVPTCAWGEPSPTLAALSPWQPTLLIPIPTSALLCSPPVVLDQQHPHNLGAEKRQGISGSTQLHSEDLHFKAIPRRGRGFPGGLDGEESACNERYPG